MEEFKEENRVQKYRLTVNFESLPTSLQRKTFEGSVLVTIVELKGEVGNKEITEIFQKSQQRGTEIKSECHWVDNEHCILTFKEKELVIVEGEFCFDGIKLKMERMGREGVSLDQAFLKKFFRKNYFKQHQILEKALVIDPEEEVSEGVLKEWEGELLEKRRKMEKEDRERTFLRNLIMILKFLKRR